MLMLKCNKHLFFHAIRTETASVSHTLLIITFMTFFAPNYFLITNKPSFLKKKCH